MKKLINWIFSLSIWLHNIVSSSTRVKFLNFVKDTNKYSTNRTWKTNLCTYLVRKSSWTYRKKCTCNFWDSFNFRNPSKVFYRNTLFLLYWNYFCTSFVVLRRHRRYVCSLFRHVYINLLSTNFTKCQTHSNSCLSVFDHFVGLEL